METLISFNVAAILCVKHVCKIIWNPFFFNKVPEEQYEHNNISFKGTYKEELC
jgi:hypothetical protein